MGYGGTLDPRPCMLPLLTAHQANRDAEAWRWQIVRDQRNLAQAVAQQRRVLDICRRTAPPTPIRRVSTVQPFARASFEASSFGSRTRASSFGSPFVGMSDTQQTWAPLAPFARPATPPDFYDAHSLVSQRTSRPSLTAGQPPRLREIALRRERDWSPELRGKYGTARHPDLPPVPRNRYWTQMFVETPVGCAVHVASSDHVHERAVRTSGACTPARQAPRHAPRPGRGL